MNKRPKVLLLLQSSIFIWCCSVFFFSFSFFIFCLQNANEFSLSFLLPILHSFRADLVISFPLFHFFLSLLLLPSLFLNWFLLSYILTTAHLRLRQYRIVNDVSSFSIGYPLGDLKSQNFIPFSLFLLFLLCYFRINTCPYNPKWNSNCTCALKK